MSWQAYVDLHHLLCDIEGNHLTHAAIIGQDGSVWAQSANFPQFKPEEITAIMNDFNEPGSLAPTGLYLGGTKYIVFWIDYQDRAKRKDEKTLEVVWRGCKSLGSSSQDDVSLFDYNVPQRVNKFVAAAISQANITRTNHIMWTMGTDFKYQYAQTWFWKLDKFTHYVNQCSHLVKAATPSKLNSLLS